MKDDPIVIKNPFKNINFLECFHEIYGIILVLFPHFNRFCLELCNSSGKKKI